MPNPERFRERVFRKERSLDQGDITIRIWHIMMKTYGWIPLDEFKRLPGLTVDALLHEINQDWENERKEYEKQKRKGKR